MLERLHIRNFFKSPIITTTRLILLFSIIFVVYSCAPRSVRYGNQNPKNENTERISKTKKNHENKEIKKLEIEEIEKFAEKLEQNKNNKNNNSSQDELDYQTIAEQETFLPEENVTENIAPQEVRKIPTLREQMKIFVDNQKATDEKVELIQSDINDIKQELSQIKQAIMDIETVENHNYTKGEPTTKKVSEVKKPEVKSKTKILPDEKPVKKETPKQNEPTTKIISENSQSFEELKANYDSGNYDKVIAELEKLVVKEKNQEVLSNSHFYLGESYFAKNQYTKAIENYKKVIEIEKAKQKDKAQSQIAESYIKSGNINLAKNAYSELIENYPTSRFVPKAKKMLQQL